MKFLIFSDLHHYPGVFMGGTWDDLTTLQREANRLLGYTAKQTLDYAQSLYEQKLLTYPRTDSKYLTTDMAETAVAVIHLVARLQPFNQCGSFFPVVTDMISDKDVTDHYAIIPTMEMEHADIQHLPAGERNLLLLVCCKLLCASAEPYAYEATTVTFSCSGMTFTAKGRRVLSEGWREIEQIFRSVLKAKQQEEEEKRIAVFSEGQIIPMENAFVTEHFTVPPKPYSEDTLLSAMETAGKEDVPEDAERKGLGTPATRSSTIEKLVTAGFVERKGRNLIPTETGMKLTAVLPEMLISPLLTAEWEHKLKLVEHGEMDAEAFMREISLMVNDLVKHYRPIRGAEVLFPTDRPPLGKCPRCGSVVTESQKGFFCECNDCRFGLWRDNKYLASKKITLSTKMVEKLLKEHKVLVRNIFSERTGSSYDAYLVLNDDGERTSYALDFVRDTTA